MRFRTAIILSIVLVGGMFILPAVVEAVFLPSLRRGLPNPVPLYEQILLDTAFFCLRYRWGLAPVTALVLLLITAVTGKSAVRRSTSIE